MPRTDSLQLLPTHTFCLINKIPMAIRYALIVAPRNVFVAAPLISVVVVRIQLRFTCRIFFVIINVFIFLYQQNAINAL